MMVLFIIGILGIVVTNFIVVQGKIHLMMHTMILAIVSNITLFTYYILVAEYHSGILSFIMCLFGIYGYFKWKKYKN